MIKYEDLVKYIKENHVNWDTDFFDVLRDFFTQYSLPSQPVQQELIFPSSEFTEPINGEYTTQDLFST